MWPCVEPASVAACPTLVFVSNKHHTACSRRVFCCVSVCILAMTRFPLCLILYPNCCTYFNIQHLFEGICLNLVFALYFYSLHCICSFNCSDEVREHSSSIPSDYRYRFLDYQVSSDHIVVGDQCSVGPHAVEIRRRRRRRREQVWVW